jgi:non-specific protein-tyrosine kinase
MAERSKNDAQLRRPTAVLRARKWTVLAITLAAGGAAALLAVGKPASYASEAEVLVRPIVMTADDAASENEVNLETEKRVAASAEIGRIASDWLDLPLGEIGEDVAVRSVPGTEILVFSFTADTPPAARAGAQAFAEAYLENRHNQVLRDADSLATAYRQRIGALERKLARLERTIDNARRPSVRSNAEVDRDIAAGELSDLRGDLANLVTPSRVQVGRVVQPAIQPAERSGPGVVATVVMALLLGLGLGIAVAFLRERTDQTLRTRIDVEAITGRPALAVVPHLRRKHRRTDARPVTVSEPSSPGSEAYRFLRTRLLSYMSSNDINTLLVTSPRRGEGKTTVTANLGAVMAQAGRRVILVSADLRRPSLHRLFGLDPDIGLSSILTSEGASPLKSVSITEDIPGLAVLPSGPIPSNPAELLELPAMASVLEQLRNEAELVIIDGPPLLELADSSTLAGLSDGVLLVADSGATSRADLAMAARAIRDVNAVLIGSVVNNFDPAKAQIYAPDAPHYSETRDSVDSIAN